VRFSQAALRTGKHDRAIETETVPLMPRRSDIATIKGGA
jgi:hypothetical protein